MSLRADRFAVRLDALERSAAKASEIPELVEALAASVSDPVVGKFFREVYDPGQARGELARIRMIAECQSLDEAEHELQRLEDTAAHVWRLALAAHEKRIQPALSTGQKQRAVLADIRDRNNAASSARKDKAVLGWQEEADRIWSKDPRLSKNAVAATVKARLRSDKSADWIARNLNKPRRAG